jgi:hypothetical protein
LLASAGIRVLDRPDVAASDSSSEKAMLTPAPVAPARR